MRATPGFSLMNRARLKFFFEAARACGLETAAMRLLLWIALLLFLPPALCRLAAAEGSHQVRRGESLGQIAKRYGMSLKELMALNRLKDANHVEVGRVLRLAPIGKSGAASIARSVPTNGAQPVPKAIAVMPQTEAEIPKALPVPPQPAPNTASEPQTKPMDVSAVAPSPNPSPPSPEPLQWRGLKSHRVAKGETLENIAQRHGSSPGQILTLNRMESAMALRVGDEVFIPVPVAEARPKQQSAPQRH